MAGENLASLDQELAALPSELKNQNQVQAAYELGMRLVAAQRFDEARECAQRISRASFPFASTKKPEQELSAHISAAESQAPRTPQTNAESETQSPEQVLLQLLQSLDDEFKQLRQIALNESDAAQEVFKNLQTVLLSQKFRNLYGQLDQAAQQRVLDARDQLVGLLNPERKPNAASTQNEEVKPVGVILSKIDELDRYSDSVDAEFTLKRLDTIVMDAFEKNLSEEDLGRVIKAATNLRDKVGPKKTGQDENPQPVRAEVGSEWVVSFEKVKKDADALLDSLQASRDAIKNKIDGMSASEDVTPQETDIQNDIINLEKNIKDQEVKIKDVNKKWNELETIYSRSAQLSLDSARKVEEIRAAYEAEETRKELDTYLSDSYPDILKELQIRLAKKVLQLRFPEVTESKNRLIALEHTEIEGDNEAAKIKAAFARVTEWRNTITTLNDRIQQVTSDPQVRKALQEEFVKPWVEKLDSQIEKAATVWKDNYLAVYSLLRSTANDSFRGILSRLLDDTDPAHKQENLQLFEQLLASLQTKYNEAKAEIFDRQPADLSIPDDLKTKVTELLDAEWKPKIEAAKVKKENRESVLKLINELRRKIQQLEKTQPIIFNMESDELSHVVGPVYEQFNSIRERGVISPEELRTLEKEVLLFDYRYTKRAIDHKMSQDENNSADSQFYYKQAYEKVFVGWGFRRLEQVRYRLNELSQMNGLSKDNSLEKLLEDIGTVGGNGDLNRFEKEIGLRRLVYFSEQTLEPLIFGAGDISKNPQRNFPEQTPEVFIDQNSLISLIKDRIEITSNPELLFTGEKAEQHEVNRLYNRELPSLKGPVKEIDFKNPGDFVEKEFTPTARGETMRLLDLLYGNKLHKVYKFAFEKKITARAYSSLSPEKYQEKMRTEEAFIEQLNGFYRTMHISGNKYIIPEIIQRAAQMILDLPAEEALSTHEIKQTWIIHTLLCRQSELVPESSPSLNDSIYKAEQWLAYLVQGAQGVRTTAASYWAAFMLFRTRVPNDPNPPTNVLDLIGRIDHASLGKLPEAHNMAQSLGHFLAMVKTTENSTSVYTKMKEALHHTYGDEFNFLLEPLAVIDRDKNHEIVPVVPTVMRYMLVSDDSPNPEVALLGNGEKSVVRWKKQSMSTPRPVNLSDYVCYLERYKYEDPKLGKNRKPELDANGKKIYITRDAAVQQWESTPFEKVLSGTRITDYYNNGANIKKLYALISAATSDKLLDPQVLAGEQNDFKYAATFFPVLGPEAAAGRYDSKAVYNRITIKHVFGMCISLLASDALDLHKLIPKLDDIAETIGQDATNAIKLVLEAGFGQSEAAQRDLQALNKQINSFFKLQA